MTKADFFCKKCRLDQTLPAHENGNRYGKWLEARCVKCRGKVMRYTTEKHTDPYLHESLKLKVQRDTYRKDLIQPGESGYKQLYKKEWDKLDKKKEEKSIRTKDGHKVRDKLYTEFSRNSDHKKALDKMEDSIEENML